MNDTIISARKTTKRIFAIPADAPAIPEKPSAAAIIANMKNVRAQPSIMCVLSICLTHNQRAASKMVQKKSKFFLVGNSLHLNTDKV